MDSGAAGPSTVSANAFATGSVDGDVVTSISIELDGSGDGLQTASALASYGYDADPIDATLMGHVTASPSSADIDAILDGNPNIATGFSDATSYFAIAELGATSGANGTTDQTAGGTLDFVVNLSALPAVDNLLMGFYDGNIELDGFTTMSFSISVDGVAVTDFAWNDPEDALTFFSDNFVDYGPISELDLNEDGLLEFSIAFSMVTAPIGNGFFGSILIGDPPAVAPHDLLLV